MTLKKLINPLNELSQAALDVIEKIKVVESVMGVEPSAVNISNEVGGVNFVDEEQTRNILHLLKESIDPFTEQIHANALELAKKHLLDSFVAYTRILAAVSKMIHQPIRDLAGEMNPDLLYLWGDTPNIDFDPPDSN